MKPGTSMRMSDFSDISVVVQGPVQSFQDREQESGITQKCLESVRQHLPGSKLILSTWPGQELAGLDYDRLVISEDPGSNVRFFGRDGAPHRFNNNRQIVSTREGLREVTTKYAVKLRSDNYLTGNNFVALQREYPKRTSTHCFLKERVVVSNVFTRQYAKGFRVPFHLSDFFYFGLTEDLRTLWDLDLFEDAQDPIHDNEGALYKSYPPDCTQMFWIKALQKFDTSIHVNELLDRSASRLEQSDLCFANNLVIASPADLGLGLCQKFLGTARISRTKGQCAQWQHWEWQEIYRRYCDPDFPKAPASVKANLFLKRLVHVHPVKLETIVKLYKNRRSSESGGIK